MPILAARGKTGWKRTWRDRPLAALAAVLVVAQPFAVQAQSRNAPDRLEDLIPDSAVENPETWAQQGADDGEPLAEPVLDADSPLAEVPEIDLAWPDELDLPPVDPVEPPEDIQFATLDLGIPEIEFGDDDRISSTTVLAFPSDQSLFPDRQRFLDQYRALSTIEELDSDEDNIALLASRSREDEELLDTLLRSYGYYDAQVYRSVITPDPGEDVDPNEGEVRFEIVPGARYLLGNLDLGNLAGAPDYAALRASFGMYPGANVDSWDIEREISHLDSALGEFGYPFAAIGEADLLIDHARVEGDLTLPVSPNGKYVFGAVTSSDDAFLSGRHLSRIARFEPGDVYQRSLQLDLRRAVTATGLVSGVTMTPTEVKAPTATEPGVVDVAVGINRAPVRTIAGAIGYGTEEGIRVQASWEHRNFFPPEGLVRVRGVIGTQEQLAGVTYRRNNFRARDRVLTVDAYASTIDSPAFDSQTAALVATYEQLSTLLYQKPFSWSAGVELLATRERPQPVEGVEPQPRQDYFVGAIPLYALIDTSDDLLDPTEGFRVGARISPEVSRTLGAQSYYVRSRVDASYYQQITDKVIIAGRAAVATIPGADLLDIAPSRRLYAGGGGSVRGYGYREIGPRDALGQQIGGRSLVEAAVEARIRTGFLDGAVSVVPFVDVGSVSTSVTPDFEEFKIGAGIGVRYHTGFGPFRLDVGVPLNPGPNDGPVAVYVSLGQAF